MKKFISESSSQTQAIAKLLSEEVIGGEVICLSGDLGAGKTTFAQGFLQGIGADGPFTSPTFGIMKEYKLKSNKQNLGSVYHIDAYRINSEDIIDLGWKDFAGSKNCVIIVEWAEKIRTIIPKNALWIHFKLKDENVREITLLQKS